MPKKKLRVWLPDDWADISAENPDGPATFCWMDEQASGAFQVSTAEYEGGDVPLPDEEALVQFAVDFGNDRQWGELKNAFAGEVPFGSYGSAVFEKPHAAEDESPYSQIWCLCNGVDFIFATFFAQEPLPPELDAAQQIAEGLNFS